MLKLAKIYSNRPEVFQPIHFRDGLNIIYAAVTKDAKDKRTSHSLGKTILADVLDYCLIKKESTKFFLRSNNVFVGLIFFLEVKVGKNLYVTIERAVAGKITIHTSNASVDVLSSSAYTTVGKNLGIDAARSALDNFAQLTVVKNALGTYRRGLRYCIRRQEEYLDIFKARNFNEKDRDWKPYLCGILGINADLVNGKYNTKETANRLKTAIRELELIDSPSQSAAALEAEIDRLSKTLIDIEKELSSFSFHRIDENITSELVDDVGAKISLLNENIYSIEQRLLDIEESLGNEFEYDIEQVKELFGSIQLNFPDQLAKTFDELIELNRKMTVGRKEHLQKAKEKLCNRLVQLKESRLNLSAKQSELSLALLEKESFKKFKIVQSKYSHEESKLAVLRERLDKIDSAADLKVRLSESIREEDQITERLLRESRTSNNGVLKSINGIFGELIKDSLGIDAYFYFSFNKDGNPHFQTGISDATTVNKGHSINKLMAACFDVALLIHYSDSQYYRFAYHDGMLESLDDRVKLRLIDSWRKIAERNGLQLILTVLDTDVPENELGSKVHFKKEEIIRELNDKGKAGRLFNMVVFKILCHFIKLSKNEMTHDQSNFRYASCHSGITGWQGPVR